MRGASATPAAILRASAHRGWPPPREPWAMRQTWNELLFAHWPVAPEELRRFVPAGLTLDTYDGQAWLSIAPFWMSGVRLRRLPTVPTTGRFGELNVRTYATTDGKGGVVFLSLDADSPLAVWAARTAFFLPYYSAHLDIRRKGETVVYASRRTHRGAPPGELTITYRPTGPVFTAETGSLDDWLTARYCLYSADRAGRLYRGEIQHAPWPLQPATAQIMRNTLASGHGVTLPDVPPLLHYAHRLDVLAWRVHRM